jgi:hypothetical protein
MKKPIKVAIISENGENDTEALQFLLNQHAFKDNSKEKVSVQFMPFLSRIKGSMWDNNDKSRIQGLIEEACIDNKPNLLLFVRDLDAFLSVIEKIDLRKEWYNSLKNAANCPTLLYIAVQKIEALILADLKNAYGKTFDNNPMYEPNPDKTLAKYGYKKNKLVPIFKKMKIENVRQNHKNHELSFNTFIENLEKEIKQL